MTRTTNKRAANAALILVVLVVVAAATLPLWILPAAAWMIATGRTPCSCGNETNRVSGLEA